MNDEEKVKEPSRNTERLNVRISPEAYNALVDTGVIERKETSALIDKLVKDHFAGVENSAEIENFRNLMKNDFAEMLKKQFDEILYWQRLCYKKDCFISELLAKEAERQSSVSFAIRKMNFDYSQAISKNFDGDSIFAMAKRLEDSSDENLQDTDSRSASVNQNDISHFSPEGVPLKKSDIDRLKKSEDEAMNAGEPDEEYFKQVEKEKAESVKASDESLKLSDEDSKYADELKEFDEALKPENVAMLENIYGKEYVEQLRRRRNDVLESLKKRDRKDGE